MTLGERIVVMSDGEVQQVGASMEVFRNPANRFVATFIGTPPMNVIDGRVESRAGEAWFVEGAWAVKLDARLSRGAGEARAIGIRPQAFKVADGDGDVTVQVEVVEPLGDQTDVVSSTPGGTRLVARVASRGGLAAGERLGLSIDWSGVHLFDGSGRRVSEAVESA